MTQVSTEKGFVILQLNHDEVSAFNLNPYCGICDYFIEDEYSYLVVATDTLMDKECFDQWYENAEYLPDYKAIELQRLEDYKDIHRQFFGFDCESCTKPDNCPSSQGLGCFGDGIHRCCRRQDEICKLCKKDWLTCNSKDKNGSNCKRLTPPTGSVKIYDLNTLSRYNMREDIKADAFKYLHCRCRNGVIIGFEDSLAALDYYYIVFDEVENNIRYELANDPDFAKTIQTRPENNLLYVQAVWADGSTQNILTDTEHVDLCKKHLIKDHNESDVVLHVSTTTMNLETGELVPANKYQDEENSN